MLVEETPHGQKMPGQGFSGTVEVLRMLLQTEEAESQKPPYKHGGREGGYPINAEGTDSGQREDNTAKTGREGSAYPTDTEGENG